MRTHDHTTVSRYNHWTGLSNKTQDSCPLAQPHWHMGHLVGVVHPLRPLHPLYPCHGDSPCKSYLQRCVLGAVPTRHSVSIRTSKARARRGTCEPLRHLPVVLKTFPPNHQKSRRSLRARYATRPAACDPSATAWPGAAPSLPKPVRMAAIAPSCSHSIVSEAAVI